ncbi:hypothetical protein LZG00_15905 [Rhodobacteraceae bacterium LMO-12]|nr:hypothetical protein [Rhodobacteraceae bacterium LMO-JJ12]
MTRPAHIEAAISRAYQIESLLRIASEAAVEDNGDFGRLGGSTVLSLAADMAGDIVMGLEGDGKGG